MDFFSSGIHGHKLCGVYVLKNLAHEMQSNVILDQEGNFMKTTLKFLIYQKDRFNRVVYFARSMCILQKEE